MMSNTLVYQNIWVASGAGGVILLRPIQAIHCIRLKVERHCRGKKDFRNEYGIEVISQKRNKSGLAIRKGEKSHD